MDRYPTLLNIQANLNNNINSLCDQNDEPHDRIGFINEVYQPTSYGAGTHTIRSSGVPNAPDFELTYTIKVTAPSNINEIQQ